MAPFKRQLASIGSKVASVAAKGVKKAIPFIQQQLAHPATTQFLKDEAKTAALAGIASGGNPAAMGAAMGGVAANFGKDVATRTINHYLNCTSM